MDELKFFSMEYCPDCGNKLVGTKKFCSNCGFDLRSLGLKDREQKTEEKDDRIIKSNNSHSLNRNNETEDSQFNNTIHSETKTGNKIKTENIFITHFWYFITVFSFLFALIAQSLNPDPFRGSWIAYSLGRSAGSMLFPFILAAPYYFYFKIKRSKVDKKSFRVFYFIVFIVFNLFALIGNMAP